MWQGVCIAFTLGKSLFLLFSCARLARVLERDARMACLLVVQMYYIGRLVLLLVYGLFTLCQP